MTRVIRRLAHRFLRNLRDIPADFDRRLADALNRPEDNS